MTLRGGIDLDAAERYERDFVPSAFTRSARRLAELAKVRSGDRVLDVACGTGVVARECLAVVGEAGRIAALDISEAMLVVARPTARAIGWVRGSAGSLPFPGETFDRVLCQFGMMFFPDPVQAVREMWRVMAPGGIIAVSISGRLEDSPVNDVLARLIRRTVGNVGFQAVGDVHALADPRAIRTVFAEARAPDVAIDTEWGWTRSPSIRSFVETEIRSWAPLSRLFDGARLDRLASDAEDALVFAVSGDGSLEFRSPYYVATASKRGVADA